MGKKVSRTKARHAARECLVQALYQWQFTKLPVDALLLEFVTEHDLGDADQAYFSSSMHELTADIVAIDAVIDPLLDRKQSALNPVELAILRLGVYELKHRVDVPYKVVLNEAIELGKAFGATDGYKYINGVLDKAAKVLRAPETSR